MTNYSERAGHVRCDQFRSSGKWYQTFTIDMEALWHGDASGGRPIHYAVRAAIETKLGRTIEGDGMIYVVLDPYHEFSHPIMLGINR